MILSAVELTCKGADGEIVPIPRLPAESIRILSFVPLVSNPIDPSTAPQPRIKEIAEFGVPAYVRLILDTGVPVLFTPVPFWVLSWKLGSAHLASID
jgi:hypothetical protein